MDITISTTKTKYLKKILNKTDIKPIVQKVIDDWLENLIRTKYESKKSVDDIINEDE